MSWSVVKSLFFVVGLSLPCIASYAKCNANMQRSAPDSRYILMGSEVQDKKTGLIWQRCSIGQTWDGNTCIGTIELYTWQGALIAAQSVGEGYRLPNVKELQSLQEVSCFNPSINSKVFPYTFRKSDHIVDGYWSSSPVVGQHLAWKVRFYLSGTNNANFRKYQAVRAVRSIKKD